MGAADCCLIRSLDGGVEVGGCDRLGWEWQFWGWESVHAGRGNHARPALGLSSRIQGLLD